MSTFSPRCTATPRRFATVALTALGLLLASAPAPAGAASGPYLAGSNLPIPASATVLTLQGLNFNLINTMPSTFQGVFKRAPYRIQKVSYPASLASTSISTGVANLDAALRVTSGPIIVLGHSQGAQVASRWMREHATDATAPGADRLTFILTGNPLRSDGGGYIVGRYEVGGTIGKPTPTTTPWTIVDVARRWDGWADWPKDTSNANAVENANDGKTSIHSRYDQVNIAASDLSSYRRGNTTYVLTRESTLPMWRWESHTAAETAAMRATIESAYDRAPYGATATTALVRRSR